MRCVILGIGRSTVTLLALSGVYCRAARAQTPAVRSGGTVASDSASARRVIDGVFTTPSIIAALTHAASDSATTAWDITVPGTTPALWERFRAQFLRDVHGRPSMPTDSLVRVLFVISIEMHGDTLVGDVLVGGRWRCRERWAGSSTEYESRVIRRGSIWDAPQAVPVSFGDSAACRP